DVHDVFRIRKPRQGIVKVANESVWAVDGVQPSPFRPGNPLMVEGCLDSFSGPLKVHWTPQVDFSALDVLSSTGARGCCCVSGKQLCGKLRRPPDALAGSLRLRARMRCHNLHAKAARTNRNRRVFDQIREHTMVETQRRRDPADTLSSQQCGDK